MNRWVDCSTQAEADTCIAAGNWPIVRAGYFEFSGSVTVRACGSVTVAAFDSVTVAAFDSATVTASDSVTVIASGSAKVTAYGSVTVAASDSVTVIASGSAKVTAYGSVTVHAFDSVTVTAFDSVTVHAFDSVTVTASPLVVIRVYHHTVKTEGGVVIDQRPPADITDWLARNRVKVSRGAVTLFKAVDSELLSGHGLEYPIGKKVEPERWEANGRCGDGLHLYVTPHHAIGYFRNASRWLAVRVKVDDLDLIGEPPFDKVKARVVTVLHEVDRDGNKLAVTA